MAIAVRPSRRRSAALALLAGLVLAVIGQGFIAGRDFILDGLVLYALGLFLVWRAFPAPPTPELGASRLQPRDSRQPLAIGVLALAVNVASLILFADGAWPNVAWLLFLLSLAGALAAAWRYDGPRPDFALRRPSAHSLTLLGIVALGLAFRLIGVDSLPAGLWWDEAFSGIHVQRILEDPSYRPVFVGGRGQGATALWYTMAPFVLLFGPTAFALRATAVLAGTLGVLATYLLGRELFGRRVGIVAAALVAVLTWHVNFSRIAFNAIWSVTLDAFAVYLLVRALRTRRLFDFALGGLMLGLAGHMYYTSRLLPVVLGIYLLHRLALERGPFLRRALPGLAVFAAVTLLTVSPLLQFALADPAEFGSRIEEASVLKETAEGGSYAPILENLKDHLLMFNYAGDRNGRHNLPGAPMLDQVVGAAFVLGLALALRGFRRPELSILLAWVPVMLAGGVFSLSYEAPQALRTIEETTAIALLAALPIEGLWRQMESLPIGRVRLSAASLGRPTLAGIVTAGILVLVAGLNYQRYFVDQANDFAVWAAFSTAETAIAREIVQLPPDSLVYVDEKYLDHPTIAYLANGRAELRPFRAATTLPIGETAAVTIFLDPETPADQIGRTYPDAEIETYGPPFEAPSVLLTARVSIEEVAAAQGLVARFYGDGDLASPPERTERLPVLDLDLPESNVLKYPLAVEVEGRILASEYGRYTFALEAPAGSVVSIDETPLIESGELGSDPALETATLARGIHRIRLRAMLDEAAPIRVLWQRPGEDELSPLAFDVFAPSVPGNGLLGSYYPNATWSGAPALEQIDPELAMRFQVIPLPRPYTVEWQGKLAASRAGTYRFGVESGGTAWIYVDGALVATDEGARRELREGQPLALEPGFHDIRVRFLDTANHSFLRVYWSPPGESRQPLPGGRLLPPLGEYPDLETVIAEPSEELPGQLNLDELPTAEYHLSMSLGAEVGLADPRGVAVDFDGNVYIADTGNHRIVKLGPEGDLRFAWGTRGKGEGEFEEPVAVAVEATGDVLVLDAAQGYIQRFSPEGAFLARFAGPAISPYHPRGLAADETGEIYVADTGASRIDRLGEDGRARDRLGNRGEGPGQLVEPTDVLVLSDGSIVVVDSGNDRGLRFDSDFRLLAEWELPLGESVYGPHLAFDDQGGIFISDPEGGRVIRFSPDGEPLDQLGGPGQLERPVGLAADIAGRLYVADSVLEMILVYERDE